GGVTRLALSDEDRAGRDLVRRWFEEAGLVVGVDDLGNMVGRRSGVDEGSPVLLGSHSDSVVRGGRYDGALGVLGALEVVRTLNDHGVETRRPVAIVNWTNEEGVRFEPAMTSSGAVAGRFGQEYVYERTDRQGLRFEDELRRIGYLGDVAERPLPAAAYLELHIEQGPVLEAAGLAVGVVGGIVGITWLEVVMEGQADHAGPSPMRLRRDALAAAARVVSGVERLAWEQDEIAVATVGRLMVEPNVINTIPGKVTFSVDFRHPEAGVLERQVERLEALVDRVARETGVVGTVRRFWTSEPTPFAPEVVEAVRAACRELGVAAGELWSGAGHDAKYLADVCPAGMIFVRSQGGLSHCETEYSTPEDIEAGANVLLGAAVTLADSR
ncbi:MAG: beta-ureidopropionase / N-carbamoyl-L-amino-acid hydrolase, partial [Thermomicrobiales bacterium]|nr:beta-ureidopropionase / N-carbamoyl-L-amino-acid hydrolase [Thermomicrobiales bacterium]